MIILRKCGRYTKVVNCDGPTVLTRSTWRMGFAGLIYTGMYARVAF